MPDPTLPLAPAAAGEFVLDPAITFLNHGSFGACPKPVLAEQDRWRGRLEAEPVRFITREMPPAMQAARATGRGGWR